MSGYFRTITLQEMLLAFKDVVVRSELFAHHHIQRERLSVRERMGDILASLEQASFVEFVRLFRHRRAHGGYGDLHGDARAGARGVDRDRAGGAVCAPARARGWKPTASCTLLVAVRHWWARPVVVGEAVVGDAEAVGVIAAPADLESLTELVLDPDFVDDDR